MRRRGHQDFIAGFEAGCGEGSQQCGGSIAMGESVSDAKEGAVIIFQLTRDLMQREVAVA